MFSCNLSILRVTNFYLYCYFCLSLVPPLDEAYLEDRERYPPREDEDYGGDGKNFSLLVNCHHHWLPAWYLSCGCSCTCRSFSSPSRLPRSWRTFHASRSW